MTPELTVVLPVRNQADHIATVVEQYRTEFQGRPWEIVLVPNACSDDSPRICRELAARDAAVRVVENPAGGWGLSVRTGLDAARGRYLCYTNSARTDPATIAALFERARPDALVKITRYGRGHFLREFGSMLYNFECRVLFRLRCRDVNGTPKIFPADLLRGVRLSADGDLLDAELLALCGRRGVRVVEVPLGGWSRHGGKSTTRLSSAVRMYLGAIRLRLEMR